MGILIPCMQVLHKRTHTHTTNVATEKRKRCEEEKEEMRRRKARKMGDVMKTGSDECYPCAREDAAWEKEGGESFKQA